MQLADSQERHAQLDDAVIECRAPLADAASSSAAWSARRRRPRFQPSAAWPARRDELSAPSKPPPSRPDRIQLAGRAATGPAGTGPPSPTPPPRPACRNALALKLEREQALGAQAQRIRRPDRQAARQRRAPAAAGAQPGPAARAHHRSCSSRSRPPAWAREQYLELLADAEADLEAVAKSIEEGGVKLAGLQGEIDRLHREIAALGAVNLAALDELTTARERKTSWMPSPPT
jgi:chromosome segregation protein